MFADKSAVALFLIGSFGFVAHAFVVTQRSIDARIDHSVLLPRQVASFSSSSSSQTQVSNFMSSWQGLSQSFSQCQSVFSQRSSITLATQSVQNLYSSYQTAVGQFNDCTACASSLSQSSYTIQIQQSVTQMYSSFQSIISTGQQYYNTEWESHFASTFQSMSSFGSFSQNVCTSAGIDLGGLLSNLGLNLNLFSNLGINLNGLIGGIGGGVIGAVGGLLGGNARSGHGLLGNLLG